MIVMNKVTPTAAAKLELLSNTKQRQTHWLTAKKFQITAAKKFYYITFLT
jgi:hypothetical protein